MSAKLSANLRARPGKSGRRQFLSERRGQGRDPGDAVHPFRPVGRERGSFYGRKLDWSFGAEFTRGPFTASLGYFDTDLNGVTSGLGRNMRSRHRRQRQLRILGSDPRHSSGSWNRLPLDGHDKDSADRPAFGRNDDFDPDRSRWRRASARRELAGFGAEMLLGMGARGGGALEAFLDRASRSPADSPGCCSGSRGR